MSRIMDAQTARALFERLTEHRFSVALGHSFHDRIVPPVTWSVTVQVGHSLNAARLREAIAVGEEYECEAHLIGGGLTFLPKPSPA